MQCWGKTGSGKQRYFCTKCKNTATRKRIDTKLKIDLKVFVSWITETISLVRTAKRLKITSRQLKNRFVPFWEYLPLPRPIVQNSEVLVVDGVSVVKHHLVVLVIFDRLRHATLSWSYVSRESYLGWRDMFFGLKVHGVEPKVIVCDGQKGLIKAIHEVWPQTIIQRCLIHISRQAKAWLTQNPKAEAGQELRLIVKKLTDIETETEKIIWLKSFDDWQKKYDYFLKEKTRHPIMEKNWWYTHKKLRAVRSLLKNSLDNLFVYLNDPRVPKTSNDVEGGINSRIKDLLRIHRGLIPKHQQVLASWYLAKRQEQKPTRNFY